MNEVLRSFNKTYYVDMTIMFGGFRKKILCWYDNNVLRLQKRIMLVSQWRFEVSGETFMLIWSRQHFESSEETTMLIDRKRFEASREILREKLRGFKGKLRCYDVGNFDINIRKNFRCSNLTAVAVQFIKTKFIIKYFFCLVSAFVPLEPNI